VGIGSRLNIDVAAHDVIKRLLVSELSAMAVAKHAAWWARHDRLLLSVPDICQQSCRILAGLANPHEIAPDKMALGFDHRHRSAQD
jgi:hypothetical protein